MDSQKSTTFRVAANLGPASQFADSSTTFIGLKAKTNHEKGEHYLQLSLATLKELACLLEDERLSASQKASFTSAYTTGMLRYDEAVTIRDQLLMQKKSFRKFLVNLFVRESGAKHFYKISYRNYSSIRRTSDDLNRLLLPEMNAIPSSGSPGESAQGDVSVSEESPPDVVGNLSVEDLSPNETIRGINLDVNTEQEAQEVFATLDRLGMAMSEEDEDDDDGQTVRPSTSESRPPSPASSCTIIYNNYYINQSVVSVDSEVTGTTINSGVNGGVGSASGWHTDTSYPWD